MPTLTYTSDLPASADDVFAWHNRDGALYRLLPPWAPVRVEHFEGVRNGDRAILRIGPGPLAVRWVAEHHDWVEGRQFCDRQVQGPFAEWDHTHRFKPLDTGSTLIDQIRYRPPGGPIGDLLAPSLLEPELGRQFAYRHRITRRDLALHQHYNPDGTSLTVAVSGSSGLVGTQLCALLSTGGHHVKRLVRSGPTGPDEILWNANTNTIEAEKLEGVDAVVHLAGENVFGLWTEEKKKRIYQSRADGTALLADALAGLDDPPDVFVSASAVGYYGDHGPSRIVETTEPKQAGFLSDVCTAWEAATTSATEAGIRTVNTRIGVVLTPAGGALQLMLPAFWMGLGGRVGDPNQYFPWITLDDVLGGLYHALWTNDLHGPVNLTAPNPVTMQEYTDTLARIVNRPAFLNVPTPVVKTLGGEMADEMLLNSARVLPKQLEDTAYPFAFPTLATGLRHLLGKTLATRV